MLHYTNKVEEKKKVLETRKNKQIREKGAREKERQ